VQCLQSAGAQSKGSAGSVIKEIINDVPDSVDYVGMVKIVLIEYVFKQDVRRSSMGSPCRGAGAAIAITAK
jgi:hypothetical protein